MSWVVEMIQGGCDCCEFIPIATFDTEAEAREFAGTDENLVIYEDSEDDDTTDFP